MEHVATWDGGYLDLPAGSRVYARHAPALPSEAEPAVAIHGLGGSSSNWTTLMTALHTDLDTWAFDLPGFGQSEPSQQHTIDSYTAEAMAFLQQFGRPVHLIGNSMGGLIAVLLAASRPDLVATLTLLAPAVPRYRLPRAGWVAAALAIPGLGAAMLARVKDLPEDVQIERMAAVLYADPAAVDPDHFAYAAEQRLKWARQPHSADVLIAALRSLISHYALPRRRAVWAAARHVLCPTLVVLSGRDALLGPRGASAWRRSLPRARVVYLPTSGHVAMMEHPELLGTLIKGFVRDASKVSSPNQEGMRGRSEPLTAS